MTWFKVDDTFYAHPKVVDLESGPCCHEAISLWVLAGSWSSGQLTNGEIPASLTRKLGFRRRVEEELVRVGLWVKTEAGFAFHDWAKYQPTREDIESKRRATKERVSRHRNASRSGVTNASPDPPSNGVSNPSPVPSRPVREKKEGESARARPTRPDAGATPEGTPPDFGPRRMLEVFRAVFLAARKADPDLGWRGAEEFCERVLATAVAQGRDAESLFRSALEHWLDKPLNDRERAAPLACFAADFAKLAEAPSNGSADSIERVRTELANVVTPKSGRWTA
jgi:hypothetical protein